RLLYLGEAKCLGGFLAQLELQAGGARELARRAEISPATLWEYQRGNFPLQWALLEKLCACVGEDARLAEPLWWCTEVERRRRRRLSGPVSGNSGAREAPPGASWPTSSTSAARSPPASSSASRRTVSTRSRLTPPGSSPCWSRTPGKSLVCAKSGPGGASSSI